MWKITGFGIPFLLAFSLLRFPACRIGRSSCLRKDSGPGHAETFWQGTHAVGVVVEMWLVSHRDPDGLVCQEERYILDTKDDGLIQCRYWQDSQFTTIHQIISKWVGHDATVNVSKSHGICYHGFPPKEPRLVPNLALGDTSSTSPFNAQDHWLKIHWEIIRYLSLNMALPLMSTAHFFVGSGKIIWHQSIFSDSANRRLIPGIGKKPSKPRLDIPILPIKNRKCLP